VPFVASIVCRPTLQGGSSKEIIGANLKWLRNARKKIADSTEVLRPVKKRHRPQRLNSSDRAENGTDRGWHILPSPNCLNRANGSDRCKRDEKNCLPRQPACCRWGISLPWAWSTSLSCRLPSLQRASFRHDPACRRLNFATH
jgi:hypothetical protein